MNSIEMWRQRARQIKKETHAVYLAYKDPRVPWYARLFVALVVGYAFSPIDLIPDPIPILGYLDDLILIPLGIALALKMIPPDVIAECREKAQKAAREDKPTNWRAAAAIIAIWILLAVMAVLLISRMFRG